VVVFELYFYRNGMGEEIRRREEEGRSEMRWGRV